MWDLYSFRLIFWKFEVHFIGSIDIFIAFAELCHFQWPAAAWSQIHTPCFRLTLFIYCNTPPCDQQFLHLSCDHTYITWNIKHAMFASTDQQCCLGTFWSYVIWICFFVFHSLGSERTFAACVKKQSRLRGGMSWWSQGQSWRLKWTSTYMAAA